MANTGYKFPSDYLGAGWNNNSAANAYEDEDWAYSTLTTDSDSWHSFGFGVPSGATVDGFLVRLRGYCVGGTTGQTAVISVKLYSVSNELFSDAKDFTFTIDGGPIDAYGNETETGGGSTDTWGLTWDADTDLVDSSEAFLCNLTVSSFEGGVNAVYIDSIEVNVYYTEAPAGEVMHIQKDLFVNTCLNI